MNDGSHSSRLAQIVAAVEGAEPADAFNALCRCCVSVFGVDGAVVSLILDGNFDGILGVSDEAARRAEELQFTIGEGPSIDADGHGRTVDALWPADWTRWPLYTSAARELGVQSMMSVPLRSGAARFGTLTMHGHTPGGLTLEALRGLDGAAQATTEWILVTLAGMRGSTLPPAFEVTSDQRAVIHQAAGMLSVFLETSIADALIALRAHAFSTGRRVEEIAAGVVSGSERLDRPEP